MFTNTETQMSIKLFQGYYTIFVGSQPVLACVSLESALNHVEAFS